MEPSQLTCPQCGLVNNYLSEACAQCGIIFVKNSTMQAPTEQDERKRKAIEEAEAILEQSDPAAGNDPVNNETVVSSDPIEDTIEMAIPTETNLLKHSLKPHLQMRPNQSKIRNRPIMKLSSRPLRHRLKW